MNRYRMLFIVDGEYESAIDFKSYNNKSAIEFCLNVTDTSEYKQADLYIYKDKILVQIAFIEL